MPAPKSSKNKITAAQEATFLNLHNKVIKERTVVLKKLSKKELITWAAYLETTLLCERIVYKRAIAKRNVGGGMQTTKKATTSQRLIPEVIADLLKAGDEVTEKTILNRLAEYPEVKESKDLYELISVNAVKEYLAAYNKILRKPFV
jgi:arsenate reductase-like glutaredoxin family protein